LERTPQKILVIKPGRKRPLRRPRHEWEDNVSLNLREIGWEVVDWIYLTQDRDQGGLLWTQTFGFYKMQGISSLAE
jgi:hypothetical protein